MMDEGSLQAALAGLPLGGLRFFGSTGSTNDEALSWASRGAQDFSVVVADEQTSGRGRSGRKWHTPPASALAVSVILRPSAPEQSLPGRFAGLGALGVVQCCRELGLLAQIKWPNDVLLNGRKVAGILAESEWAGHALDACVLGIGVNVSARAVPPAEHLSFPATSLETELGRPLHRTELLRDILKALLHWRSQIDTPWFVQAWQDSLAFRDQQVSVGRDGEPALVGRLLGLEPDGSLRLMVENTPVTVHFGEIHLRPTNDRIG